MTTLVNIAQFEDKKTEEYGTLSLSSNYFHSKTINTSSFSDYPIRLNSSMKTSSIRIISNNTIKLSIDDCEPFLIPKNRPQHFSISPNSKITSIEEIITSSDSFPINTPIINITEYDDLYRPVLNINNESFISSSFSNSLFQSFFDSDSINPEHLFENEISLEEGIISVGIFNATPSSVDKSFEIYIDEDTEEMFVRDNGTRVADAPSIWIIHNVDNDDYFSLSIDYQGVLSVKIANVSSSPSVGSSQMIRYFGQNTRNVRVVTNSLNVYATISNRGDDPDSEVTPFLLSPFQIHRFQVSPSRKQRISVFYNNG